MMTRALASLLVWCVPAVAYAADIRLPAGAAALPAQIAAACPECPARGYTPCGSADVAWGRRFASTALLGVPKRGYLVTFTLTADDFRTLARSTDYEPLLTTLHDRFATSRAVVIEDGFSEARVLASPTRVAVTFPKPLHQCLRDTTHPWGCCISDCHKECCEKDLGSPRVDLEWQDGAESLHFHYTHTPGTTWLKRKTKNQETHYYCLTDAKGVLKWM
jgi:hypothetical protein